VALFGTAIPFMRAIHIEVARCPRTTERTAELLLSLKRDYAGGFHGTNVQADA
jgi:hypothetical protein